MSMVTPQMVAFLQVTLAYCKSSEMNSYFVIILFSFIICFPLFPHFIFLIRSTFQS